MAEYAVEHKGNLKGFSDSSFLDHAGHNFTAQVGVLAMMDIPERAGSHGLRGDGGRGLEISAASNLVLLVREVRETQLREESSMMVVQRYFDVVDQDAEVSALIARMISLNSWSIRPMERR